MPKIKIKCPICGREIRRTWARQRTCLEEQCRRKWSLQTKRDFKRAQRAGTWKRIVFDPVGYREKRKNNPEVIWEAYQRSAKRRGFIFDISLEQFVEWWKLPCFYCGGEIRTIGLDRIDNSKGYTKDNIAPCCSICNKMKMTMGRKEFVQQCKKIAKHG